VSADVPAASPEHQAELRFYLQKRLRIPDPKKIALSPVVRTPISGLLAQVVRVTNGKGKSIGVTLFTDRDGLHFILGRYLNLRQDPWGRRKLDGIRLDDRPTLGPEDAPVTMVEFADFECPYCAEAFKKVETLVRTKYRGHLRLVFKNYPLHSHPWARDAAIAAECARLQNPRAFWRFAREFYTAQGKINRATLKSYVDDLALKNKLDSTALRVCMNGKAATERVDQDIADAKTAKVASTPTFFIDGIPVVGLPEGGVLDFVIRTELAEKDHAVAKKTP